MRISTLIGYLGGLLITLALILSLAQMRVLLQRYEEESNLSECRMFQTSAFFVRALPGHMRSVHYAFHLALAWLLSESWFRRMPGYSDFTHRSEIIGNFTRGEIYCVVAMTSMGSGGLLLVLIGGVLELVRSSAF